jgi:hypothetical protein
MITVWKNVYAPKKSVGVYWFGAGIARHFTECQFTKCLFAEQHFVKFTFGELAFSELTMSKLIDIPGNIVQRKYIR